MLEQEILKSFIAYPHLIDEFLEKAPLKCFSKESAYYLKIILDLKDKNLLSLSVFLQNVDKNHQQSEYFLSILSADESPLFLQYAPFLLKEYKLKIQEQIANTLNQASQANTLLDLELLAKDLEVESKDILDLNKWLLYYEKKPSMRKYPTSLAFLDNAFEGGFELAQLMLVSGDEESGKTTLCVQILEELAKSTKVCFFSFEFTVEQYLRSFKELNKKTRFENFFLINDGYELSQITENIKKMARAGVKFFLIDSQMRIEVSNTTKQALNMEEKESLKFSTLAKLCHSLEIFIFLIVQTSKSDTTSPTGSKKGAHEASIILRIEKIKPNKEDITQKNNEFDEFKRILILRKNKQTGKHFKGEVAFNPQKRAFSDLKSENVKSKNYIDMKEIKSELSFLDIF